MRCQLNVRIVGSIQSAKESIQRSGERHSRENVKESSREVREGEETTRPNLIRRMTVAVQEFRIRGGLVQGMNVINGRDEGREWTRDLIYQERESEGESCEYSLKE